MNNDSKNQYTINLTEEIYPKEKIDFIHDSINVIYDTLSKIPCQHVQGSHSYIKTFWSKVFGTNGIKIYHCIDCNTFIYGKELKLFIKFINNQENNKCKLCGTLPLYIGCGNWINGCVHNAKEFENDGNNNKKENGCDI